jgi:hypothetical protein
MIHQCPKCELRFDHKTELDQHCRDDHPLFHHDYPVSHAAQPDERVGSVVEAMGEIVRHRK